MNLYETAFTARDVKIAQVLLTEDDFTDRKRYSNLRHTIERLLKLRVIPIVNENDTVSTAEIELFDSSNGRIFSDNDRLAALIMSKLEADALIILTNVDGVLDKEGSVIPVVTDLNHDFGTGARVQRLHLDGREVDLRQRRQRQEAIAEQAGQHDGQHEQRRRHRPLDEWRRRTHRVTPSAARPSPRAAPAAPSRPLRLPAASPAPLAGPPAGAESSR